MGRNEEYKTVKLYEGIKKGKESCRTHYVHRLLCDNFLKKPKEKNKTQVDHRDGNKMNNNICNLRWASAQDQRRNRESVAPLSGVTGVTKTKYSLFQVRHDRRTWTCKTLKEAEITKLQAEKNEWGQFFNLNRGRRLDTLLGMNN